MKTSPVTEKETRNVTVYRDHPDWDKYDRWFQLPSPLLRELFICKYVCDEDNFHFQLKWIEKEHPDCVYVY